jgi:hypothetical protein
MEPGTIIAEGATGFQDSIDTLKTLEPDVILLQSVPDWRMCAQLAEALKPLEYNVLICSAFRGPSVTATGQTQVAILSRWKAYFTWSEVWPSQKQEDRPQGMALAAIQAGTQRLAFATALAANRESADELPRAILRQFNSIGSWETNRVQTFVVGASFAANMTGTARAVRRAALVFDRAGLVDAAEELPQEQKATLRRAATRTPDVADCLLAGPKGFPSKMWVTASAASLRYPVTCDIELDAEKVATALEIRAANRGERRVQTAQLIRKMEYWGAGILVCAMAIFVGLRIRAKKRARAAWTSRGGLPVQITVKAPSPGPLRRAGSSGPASKESNPPTLPLATRQVLRLQTPSKRETKPPVQPPTTTPSTEDDPGDHSASDPGVAPQDPPTPSASLGQPTEVQQGVIRELSSWLKHKLVQRLVSDRAQMMEAQQLATRMATTLDNRLARIEAQIQKQNEAYVQRIEELNQELAAAREENRELIRERIVQVKAEMEAARARVLAEANLDNTSFRL